jgi:Cupin-like domain
VLFTTCPAVPYYSHQNDCLRCELPQLMADVPPSIPLAAEAFGNQPDAVNVWIGDDRSVSSVHKVLGCRLVFTPSNGSWMRVPCCVLWSGPLRKHLLRVARGESVSLVPSL